MSELQDLNVEKAANAVCERYAPKLERLEADEMIRVENSHILVEFTKIAIQLIKEDPQIFLPDGASVPIDKALAKKVTLFFTEGIFMALAMCKSKNITGEIRTYLLQQSAMDIFARSKTLAISDTQEKETSKDLLKQMVAETLKNHVREYEKINGPILGRKAKVQS